MCGRSAEWKKRQRKAYDREMGLWRAKAYAHYSKRCMKCEATEDITLDHIAPISMGGTNHIGNFQLLCRSCNIEKGQTAVDYRTRRERKNTDHLLEVCYKQPYSENDAYSIYVAAQKMGQRAQYWQCDRCGKFHNKRGLTKRTLVA